MTIQPSLDTPSWPEPLRPSGAAENGLLTRAWLHFFTGQGELPQMPQNWNGGQDRWDQQIAFVREAAAVGRQHSGRGDAPAASSTSAASPASAAPAPQGGGRSWKKIGLGLAVLVTLGVGVYWLRRRRGPGSAASS